MANLKAQFAIICILGLPVFIAAVIFGPTAFKLAFRHRPPERYLIPAGFTGWARVDYRQKDAPPLANEDGRRLLKLDAQGMAATSSDPPSGHGRDDFLYFTAERRTPLPSAGVCKGGMIWQVQTMVDERTSMPFTRFFVGTEEQYRQAVDPMGTIVPNCD
jgi:Family of unknown function (DUF6843)